GIVIVVAAARLFPELATLRIEFDQPLINVAEAGGQFIAAGIGVGLSDDEETAIRSLDRRQCQVIGGAAVGTFPKFVASEVDFNQPIVVITEEWFRFVFLWRGARPSKEQHCAIPRAYHSGQVIILWTTELLLPENVAGRIQAKHPIIRVIELDIFSHHTNGAAKQIAA